MDESTRLGPIPDCCGTDLVCPYQLGLVTLAKYFHLIDTTCLRQEVRSLIRRWRMGIDKLPTPSFAATLAAIEIPRCLNFVRRRKAWVLEVKRKMRSGVPLGVTIATIQKGI